MCLTLSKKSKFKIAKEDIVVTKLVQKNNNTINSFFRSEHKWVADFMYLSDITVHGLDNISYRTLLCIDKFSFITKAKVFKYNLFLKLRYMFYKYYKLTIEHGFHSYADPTFIDYCATYRTDVIMQSFIIPKGSIYIVGNYENCHSADGRSTAEVVSNRIIMTNDAELLNKCAVIE